MQVQNSKRAKPFLVVVNSAIVYQIIEFSPSLALHLTAYSARDAGLRRWQAFGGRAAISYHANTWEGMPVIRMAFIENTCENRSQSAKHLRTMPCSCLNLS